MTAVTKKALKGFKAKVSYPCNVCPCYNRPFPSRYVVNSAPQLPRTSYVPVMPVFTPMVIVARVA